MKTKLIIFITSILLLTSCYLLFKTNYKKKLEVDSSAMKTNAKIVIPNNSIDSTIRKYDYANNTYQWADFEYTPKEINVGKLVLFKDLTKNAKSWEWKFGESKDTTVIDSKVKNPAYTYKESGLKKITLVVNKDYIHSRTSHILVWVKGLKYGVVCGYPTDQGRYSCPEIKLNEKELNRALMGISQNKLSYRNFAKYFCKSKLPPVYLNGNNAISLHELDEIIRGKNILIKITHFKKDKNECITDLHIDYQLLK